MAATRALAVPSPRRAELRVPLRYWHVGIAATAVLLGVAAAFQPLIAVAAMVGLLVLPIVLVRPIVGLAVLVFLSFLESYSAMTGFLTLTKIVGVTLVIAWFAIVATRRAEDERDGMLSREPLLGAALLLFTAWAAMSLVWAESPDAAQTSVLRFAQNFVLFPIMLVAIRAPRHALWIVATFVAGALAAVALGFSAGTLADPDAQGRLKGAGLNPNQLGSYLAAAAIITGVLAANRRWSALARCALLATAGIALISVLLTLSRGALVGLGAALLLAPIVIGRGRRVGALALIVAAIVGGVGWYAAVAPASAVDRITHPSRNGGSGRENLWLVGWRMVEDKPIVGVGAGNYPVSSIHYVLRPGFAPGDAASIVDRKKVAHNIYLTVLSELGAVGLALFMAILLACLRSALRAARKFAAQGELVMELLARGLFLALVNLLVAGFFSSSIYIKQLWVLLAAGPALLALAERADRASFWRRPGSRDARV
jgi:O-antigen ligase